MIVTLLALLLLSQSAAQPAYILDHPIDPNLRIIATQDGRYPFALLAGTDCSWVHSDMNVEVVTSDQPMWQLSLGSDSCSIAVSPRLDTPPCFSNDAGDCDIAGEHNF